MRENDQMLHALRKTLAPSRRLLSMNCAGGRTRTASPHAPALRAQLYERWCRQTRYSV